MFSFLKKKKADNRELYRRIDKKPLKYVTERDLETYVESVIGKEGRINIYDDEIAIQCNGTEVFRCKLDGADIGEGIFFAEPPDDAFPGNVVGQAPKGLQTHDVGRS